MYLLTIKKALPWRSGQVVSSPPSTWALGREIESRQVIRTKCIRTKCIRTKCIRTKCIRTECIQTKCIRTKCIRTSHSNKSHSNKDASFYAFVNATNLSAISAISLTHAVHNNVITFNVSLHRGDRSMSCWVEMSVFLLATKLWCQHCAIPHRYTQVNVFQGSMLWSQF
jgi:hypothetical protein